MKYTAVIWDFNGTIADDIDLGIGAVNKMLAERGLPILSTREEYRAKLRFPIKDYYADLGFDFSKEPYEKLAHEWIALYNAGEKDVRACAGAPEAIRRISESGLEQIILSDDGEHSPPAWALRLLRPHNRTGQHLRIG